MRDSKLPTQRRLQQLLSYDQSSGAFSWVASNSNRALAGAVAGTFCKNGYRYIGVDGTQYLAHRLAWVYMTGEAPPAEIDHIDTNRTNNAWSNLRSCGRRMNAENQRRPNSRGTTGFLGVTRSRGRFKAQIQTHGRNKGLGLYETPELAHAAYVRAKRLLHEGCTL